MKVTHLKVSDAGYEESKIFLSRTYFATISYAAKGAAA